jgi:hypothetical protein
MIAMGLFWLFLRVPVVDQPQMLRGNADSLSAVHSTYATQKVPATKLLAGLKARVATELPDYTHVRGGESGAGSGHFHGTWRERTAESNTRDLSVWCDQYVSGEEAIKQLRSLRMAISIGPPHSLPGVADEAYFHNYNGRWTVYFATHQFVCQLGSPSEGLSRQLTQLVVAEVNSAR